VWQIEACTTFILVLVATNQQQVLWFMIIIVACWQQVSYFAMSFATMGMLIAFTYHIEL